MVDAVNEKASNETLKATRAQLYSTLSTRATDENYLELQLTDPNSLPATSRSSVVSANRFEKR